MVGRLGSMIRALAGLRSISPIHPSMNAWRSLAASYFS
jgi:hypothetical protein